MNLIVAATAFLIASRLLKFSGFIDGILAFFVFYFAQIVAGEIFLGSIGKLYLTNIIFLNFSILLFTWLFTRNRQTYFNTGGLKNTLLDL